MLAPSSGLNALLLALYGSCHLRFYCSAVCLETFSTPAFLSSVQNCCGKFPVALVGTPALVFFRRILKSAQFDLILCIQVNEKFPVYGVWLMFITFVTKPSASDCSHHVGSPVASRPFISARTAGDAKTNIFV